uniref:Uncharacterized protein n=1 Tax=Populus alba TaxID=43335 RepID=A0A4U5QNV3_POPAL|nr:hypothetical protein D5086_0000062970 [Populus alba]
MCKCRSHGTFPLFGLQSSHLNICYDHQDLHRRPLRPGSRPGFCSDRRALLLIGAWRLPRRPGIGRALQRHPFSGLVDSAARRGTVTRLPVHPASPVLLTKNGPLGALDSVARLNEAAAPSYLFKSFAPRPKSDERGARQYRCGPPPEGFPLASPRSGIVHHLSGPDRHALTRTLRRRSRSGGGATLEGIPPVSFLAPYGVYSPGDSHTCQTPGRGQDGTNGEPTGRGPERAWPGHAGTARAAGPRARRRRSPRAGFQRPGRGRHREPQRSTPRADRRTGRNRATSDRGASPAPSHGPPDKASTL